MWGCLWWQRLPGSCYSLRWALCSPGGVVPGPRDAQQCQAAGFWEAVGGDLHLLTGLWQPRQVSCHFTDLEMAAQVCRLWSLCRWCPFVCESMELEVPGLVPPLSMHPKTMISCLSSKPSLSLDSLRCVMLHPQAVFTAVNPHHLPGF